MQMNIWYIFDDAFAIGGAWLLVTSLVVIVQNTVCKRISESGVVLYPDGASK